jgi:copper chaperone CopZ
MNESSKLLAAFGLSAGVALCPCCSTTAHAEPPVPLDVASAKTVSLTVEAVTCASCSIAVRTALEKLGGVKEVQVSVADKRAVVDYEPAKVTPQQIVETINNLGYRASLPKGLVRRTCG